MINNEEMLNQILDEISKLRQSHQLILDILENVDIIVINEIENNEDDITSIGLN
jgi:hypothetical protein